MALNIDKLRAKAAKKPTGKPTGKEVAAQYYARQEAAKGINTAQTGNSAVGAANTVGTGTASVPASAPADEVSSARAYLDSLAVQLNTDASNSNASQSPARISGDLRGVAMDGKSGAFSKDLPSGAPAVRPAMQKSVEEYKAANEAAEVLATSGKLSDKDIGTLNKAYNTAVSDAYAYDAAVARQAPTDFANKVDKLQSKPVSGIRHDAYTATRPMEAIGGADGSKMSYDELRTANEDFNKRYTAMYKDYLSGRVTAADMAALGKDKAKLDKDNNAFLASAQDSFARAVNKAYVKYVPRVDRMEVKQQSVPRGYDGAKADAAEADLQSRYMDVYAKFLRGEATEKELAELKGKALAVEAQNAAYWDTTDGIIEYGKRLQANRANAKKELDAAKKRTEAARSNLGSVADKYDPYARQQSPQVYHAYMTAYKAVADAEAAEKPLEAAYKAANYAINLNDLQYTYNVKYKQAYETALKMNNGSQIMKEGFGYTPKSMGEIDDVLQKWQRDHTTYRRDNTDTKSKYDLLRVYGNAEEKQIFAFVLEKDGKDAAKEYLDFIRPLMDTRYAAKMAKKYRDADFFGRMGLGFTTQAAGGLSDFSAGLTGVGKALIGDTSYTFPTTAQSVASGVREAEGGAVAGAAMDIIRSTANMAPSIAVGAALSAAGMPGASLIQSLSFGGSAGGNAYIQSINDGKDYGEAVLYGAVVGTSEACLERVLGGIEGLGGKGVSRFMQTKAGKAVQARLSSFLSKFGTTTKGRTALEVFNATGRFLSNNTAEGLEEFTQDMLDPIFRNVIFGEDNAVFTQENFDNAMYSFCVGFWNAGLLNAPKEISRFKTVNRIINGTGTETDVMDALESPEMRRDLERVFTRTFEMADGGNFAFSDNELVNAVFLEMWQKGVKQGTAHADDIRAEAGDTADAAQSGVELAEAVNKAADSVADRVGEDIAKVANSENVNAAVNQAKGIIQKQNEKTFSGIRDYYTQNESKGRAPLAESRSDLADKLSTLEGQEINVDGKSYTLQKADKRTIKLTDSGGKTHEITFSGSDITYYDKSFNVKDRNGKNWYFGFSGEQLSKLGVADAAVPSAKAAPDVTFTPTEQERFDMIRANAKENARSNDSTGSLFANSDADLRNKLGILQGENVSVNGRAFVLDGIDGNVIRLVDEGGNEREVDLSDSKLKFRHDGFEVVKADGEKRLFVFDDSLVDAVLDLYGDNVSENTVAKNTTAEVTSGRGVGVEQDTENTRDAENAQEAFSGELALDEKKITSKNDDVRGTEILRFLKAQLDNYFAKGGNNSSLLNEKSPEKQLSTMKMLYSAISKKPTWLSQADIEEYDAKVLLAKERAMQDAQAKSENSPTGLLKTDKELKSTFKDDLSKLFGAGDQVNDLCKDFADDVFGIVAVGGWVSKKQVMDFVEDVLDSIDVDTKSPDQSRYNKLRRDMWSNPIPVSESVRRDFTDWSDFRKAAHKSGVRFVNKEGTSKYKNRTSIDQRWIELREEYPELFRKDITNAADQIRELVATLEEIRRKNNEKKTLGDITPASDKADMVEQIFDMIERMSGEYRLMHADYAETNPYDFSDMDIASWNEYFLENEGEPVFVNGEEMTINGMNGEQISVLREDGSEARVRLTDKNTVSNSDGFTVTFEESGRKAEFVFPMEEMEPPVSDTEYRRELGLLSKDELVKDSEGYIEDEGISWNEAFPESVEDAKGDTVSEQTQQEKADVIEKVEKAVIENARDVSEDSESRVKSPVVRRIRFEDDTGRVSADESTVNNEAAKEAASEPARSAETGRVTESISESEIKREALPETKNASESTVKKADVPANERANTKTNEAAVKSSTENVSKKNAMVEEKKANVSEKAVEKPTEKAAVDANVAGDSKAIGDVSTSSVSAENSKNTRINAIKEAAVSPNEALKEQGRSNAYSDKVYRDLTKKSVKAAEALSGALGVDIKLFGGENGIGNFYDSGDNVLYLNANGELPLQYELRRGLMTMLASSDSAGFAKLRDFLVGKYKETFGKDAYTEYAEKKKQEFSKNGLSLDDGGVGNELCADLCMRMLSDADTAKAIAKELRTPEAKKLLRALEMLSKTEEVNFDFLPTSVEALDTADMKTAEKMFLDALFRDNGGTRKNSYALDVERAKADTKNNSSNSARASQKAESRAVEAPDESSVREDMSREASPLSNAEAERVENVPQTESDTSKRATKPQTEVNSKETAEKAKNESVPEVNSKAESEIASDGNDGISEEARGVLETIRRTAQSPKEALKAKKHGDVYSGADEQTIRVAEDLSKAFGVRILLFDGNGKTDIDGFYDRKSNTIYLNAGNHAKPLQATVRHEMVHFLAQANKGAFEAFRDFVAGRYAETYGKDALNTWLDNKKAEYEAAGIELDENSAKEELCADLAMDMLTDAETVKGFAKENRSAARRILDALRRFIDKIRVLFGLEPKYTAGKARALEALSKTDSTVKVTDGKVERSHASFKNDTLPKALNVKDLYAAEKLLYQALTSAEIRNSNTNSDGIRFSGETDSDTDIITVKDIDNLRSIGRKSVNDFTSEDIKKAEPFARRYFKELGVKSPFFRAWFGDWRAHDTSEVKVVSQKSAERGKVKNTDTGWDILVSRQVFKETQHHSSESVKNAVKYLPYIGDITQNAVLLSSEMSGKENSLSVMFHTFYGYTEVMGYPALLRLKVEELIDEKSGESIRRNYILQTIEEEPISESKRFSKAHQSETGSSVNSISDLYALVKTYDKDFHAKDANPELLDEDGKPLVVYHGTDADFTVFDRTKGRSSMDIQGMFFSPWELDAQGYGKKVGAYYINLKNPADESTAYKALNMFKGQNNSGIKARDYLIKLGYDGVNNSGEEFIAFYPEQIKSATDNIGTFDGANPDIRYSKSGTAADTKKNVFSYEALTAKPDMPLTDINTSIPRDANGKVIRKDVADRALKAVRDSGNKKNTDVDSYVHVDDTNSDLKVSIESIRHGLTRKPDLNAIAALNIVGLAKNAVLINELSPREGAVGGNVYLSAGKDSDNNLYFARLVTDKKNLAISEIETVYAINAKKESVAHYRQGYENKIPFAFTDSTISIADLLDFVKNHFSDILPESVLQHYGISRKESAVSDSVMYSLNAEKDSVQTIPKGEDPARDVDVRAFDERGGKVSEGVRTVAEASVTPDSYVRPLLEDVAKGKYSHEIKTNKGAMAHAENVITRDGYQETVERYLKDFEDGRSFGKDDIAVLQTLYAGAAQHMDYLSGTDGDITLAEKLVVAMVQTATNAGQALQAQRLLKKLSPEGTLYAYEKSVNNINRAIERSAGEWDGENNTRVKESGKGFFEKVIDSAQNGYYSPKQAPVEIDSELKKKLLNAKNPHEMDKVCEEIENDVAKQILSTIPDKLRAWRYMSMLTNPRTHVRNLVGNALFGVAVQTRDIIGTIAERAIIRDKSKRTKAIALTPKQRSEYKAIAKHAARFYDEHEAFVKGESSRFDAPTSGINAAKKPFKNRFLNAIYESNFKWLEKEDLWFIKGHFVRQFTHALMAKGYKAEQLRNGDIPADVLQNIAEYASNESQKATFRDANAAATVLNRIENMNRVTKVAVSAIMPFKKTPMNILRRGMEYSPVSLITAIYKTISQNVQKKKGRIKSVDTAGIINDLSQGLTGSMIFAMGAWLLSEGILKAGDDENDQKQNLEEAMGKQSYSIEIGGESFTLDWAAPLCMPLFSGAEFAKALQEKEINPMQVLLRMSDPILETSMMSGVLDFISSAKYADGNSGILQSMTQSAVSSYVLQYFPTVMGAVARVMDEYESRTTRTDKKGDAAFWERLGRQIVNKIPYARQVFNKPYVDLFGKLEKKEKPIDYALSLVKNTIVPGYIASVSGTNSEQILYDVMEESKETKFIPSFVTKFAVDKVQHTLSQEEYYNYHVMRGEWYETYLPEVASEEWFTDLEADEKAIVLEKFKDIADDLTKKRVIPEYSIRSNRSKYIYHMLYGDEPVSGQDAANVVKQVFHGIVLSELAKKQAEEEREKLLEAEASENIEE